MKSFSQFGSDLDASTVSILKHGEALLEVLKQPQYNPYPLEKEIFYLFVAKNKFLDNLPKAKISEYLDKCYKYVNTQDKKVLASIKDQKEITSSNENRLLELVTKFAEIYKSAY